MPNKTSIGWCDLTSNPLYAVRKSDGKRGWWCSKVSPGCAHCYAEALNFRWGNKVPYLPANRYDIEWRLNERELQALTRRTRHEVRGTGRPPRVFLGSMIDIFHETIPLKLLLEVFIQIAICSQLTFQVLTKRPERAKAFLEFLEPVFASEMWPLPNLWLGVSAENQHWADQRIPVLLDTPAAVRFVSCEPLLGPIDLHGRPAHERHLCVRCGEGPDAPHEHRDGYRTRGLDWGIVGGESGPRHRPMQREWAYDLVERQFRAAGVPVFYKQGAGRFPGRDRELWGKTYEQFPKTPEEPVGVLGS